MLKTMDQSGGVDFVEQTGSDNGIPTMGSQISTREQESQSAADFYSLHNLWSVSPRDDEEMLAAPNDYILNCASPSTIPDTEMPSTDGDATGSMPSPTKDMWIDTSIPRVCFEQEDLNTKLGAGSQLDGHEQYGLEPVLKHQKMNLQQQQRSRLPVGNFKLNQPPAAPYRSQYAQMGSQYYGGDLVDLGEYVHTSAYSGNVTLDNLTPPQSATYSRSSTLLHSPDAFKRHGRKQSMSKMPLSELFTRMGLSHDHTEAKAREERVIDIIRSEGFDVGKRTWIRDTEESERKRILNVIFMRTFEEYGYDHELLEKIVRRGTYARMQSRLRKSRRVRKAGYS